MDRNVEQETARGDWRKPLAFALLAVVLVVLALAAIRFIVPQGTGDPACCGVFPQVAWKVQRTGPDSIGMTLLSVDPRIDTGAETPAEVRIFAGGKEISNASVIRAGGLSDTVSPPEGLLFREGSFVTFAGEDLRPDATKPLRLQVMIGNIASKDFGEGTWYMVYDACPDGGSAVSCYSTG